MPRYSVFGDNMIAKADLFAFAAHTATGQVRKYTHEPYITHPRAVAGMVQALPRHSWQQVVWALIHDTVEDTQISIDDIRKEFGDEIADGLHFLTNVDRSAGNRARRHAMNCERLSLSPPRVATVKVLDIRHNIERIVELDPKFAAQYLIEKVEAMKCLHHADDANAWGLTFQRIEELLRECADKGLVA